MNVLSLFNGMSFCAMALETLGIHVNKYYSSEIDKYANQAAQALYPNTIQLGDVTKWREWDIDWASIDLLVAGFPCQAWSMAGKQQGDNDPRGALVHDLIDIWNEIKVKNPNMKFMFENVKMKKEFLDYINDLFGVEPICINSALVSAQNRKRYYWTNISKVRQPEDKGVVLSQILEDLPSCPVGIAVREKSNCLRVGGRGSPFDSKQIWGSPFKRITKKGVVKPSTEKAACLTGGANSGGNHSDMDILVIQKPRGNNPGGERALNGKTPCMSANSWHHNNHVKIDLVVRRFSVRECARLQTVPERNIDTLLNTGVSNSQLYKMLGNGWTHDVIVHIFKNLPARNVNLELF
jgi:DNA (cytosine-5)-methyltransferase 1/DNA (cytosine-5)-methyltransferase 3A